MSWAASHRHINIVHVRTGIDLNKRLARGNSYLMEAVLGRQTESVEALIHAGADVNAQRDDGMSALNVASSLGFTDIVSRVYSRHVAGGEIPPGNSEFPPRKSAGRIFKVGLKCQNFSLFTVVAATGDPLSGHRLSNP